MNEHRTNKENGFSKTPDIGCTSINIFRINTVTSETRQSTICSSRNRYMFLFLSKVYSWSTQVMIELLVRFGGWVRVRYKVWSREEQRNLVSARL